MKKQISMIPIFIVMIFLFSSHAFGITIYTKRPPNNLSKEPVFRIETGMHTSPARQIGVDGENRYIVTGSDDKTVRIWEFSTGNLLKTLRPPIGDHYEGNIYSVAVSPDNKTIACGGWTMGGDIFHNIYLFDRENGSIKGRIPDIVSSIRHLQYSKDGKYLVAMLGGKNGFNLYNVSDNSLAAEDKNYDADCYGADFDSQNRLVTASWDGFIRLYDTNFKLVAKVKSRGGNKPFSVRFAPDGSKVVAGFNDSTNVDVLSGKDLSYLYSPDTKFADNGNLEVVSWSDDGKYLYAGGRFQADARFPVYKWSGEGKGGAYRLDGIRNSITDIVPLKGGGIAYSSADPSFGVFNRHDERILYKSPSIGDYRNREGFLLSDNGFIVQFEYGALDKTSGRFSIFNQQLEIIKEDDAKQRGSGNLKPAITSAETLGITDWEDSYHPKLKGVPLKLDQYEFSRSLSIAPDKSVFLLGTSWNLRLFDISGTEKWHVTVPSTPWALNISGNGKIAVVAFGDGVIRWYRTVDGKNILNLFAHKDKKRWVIWMPAGYYDASAGAEELIGWHVNNSPDMASDFFSISRFRNIYYRPDMIEKVMETLDEKEAIRVTNQESGKKMQEEEVSVKKMLPPVVNIISPVDNALVSNTNILVKFTVRSSSEEPITDLKALVNGRPVATTRDMTFEEGDPKTTGILERMEQEQGVEPKTGKTPVSQENAQTTQTQKESPTLDGTKQITVVIPPEDAQISIIASNKFAASEPATVRIKWQGKIQKDEFVISPKLYILAIGVGKYINFPPENQLKYAAKDAHDFVEAMKGQKGKLYRDIGVRLLIDDTATRDNILDGLEWIQKETTSKDVAMVFLSGHGVNDNTGIYYFVPTNFDKKSIKRSGVPYGDIKNTVANLAGKTLVFVDTCHSGNVMGTRKALGDITNIANELASAENGAVVFASSTGRQFSLERPEWNNGAFTKALIEGLNGKADYTKKGKVSINMLDLYLSERVKELTDGQQTPTTTKPQTIQDFPVAVVR
ncbi:MAG: caspase family protein [Proteobacteria bacterium]|nr:caspase family protein [Pseudomonadota bacterium]